MNFKTFVLLSKIHQGRTPQKQTEKSKDKIMRLCLLDLCILKLLYTQTFKTRLQFLTWEKY